MGSVFVLEAFLKQLQCGERVECGWHAPVPDTALAKCLQLKLSHRKAGVLGSHSLGLGADFVGLSGLL